MKVNGSIEANSLKVNGNSISSTTRYIASFSAQNQSSIITVIDTIFSQEELNEFVQGLINYDTNNNPVVWAKTEVRFGVAGNQDEYLEVYGSNSPSTNSYANYCPQSTFFFPIKTDYGNNDLQLTIKLAGNYANAADIKGNIWGK